MAAMDKCDCLNECGDDSWLRDGRAEPCADRKREIERLAQRERDKVLLEGLAARLRSQVIKGALTRILKEIK